MSQPQQIICWFVGCLGGGFCLAHGEYQAPATQCPRWPACLVDKQVFAESKELKAWLEAAVPDVTIAPAEGET